MDNEKQLFSQQAEEAFIGAALIDPGNLQQIDLEPEDIYIQRHRWIYEAMQALQSRKCDPDFITLTEELDRTGKLAELGGASEIVRLFNRTSSSLGLSQYADIIKGYARRRRVLKCASELAKAAYADGEIDEQVSGVVDQLTTGIRPKNGAVHWSGALQRLYDRVEERAKNPTDIWGMRTGFTDYDRATGGLHQGESVYIAGEPGAGKSKLSLQMGVNLGAAGETGAIYSLEMKEWQITARAVSSMAKMATRKLKSGRLEGEDWSALIQAIEKASEYPIYLSDQSELTTGALRADLARLKLRYGIKWFVLDYMFLMADGDGKMDDTQRTALLSRRIKTIAADLDLAAVTVNSVTKEGMGASGALTQKNVRGSGQVVHDADVICFITKHIPDKSKWETEDENLVTVSFAKGRELENPKPFHLVKFEHYPAFGNYAPERAGANGSSSWAK
jgi:replicative DNA helicase